MPWTRRTQNGSPPQSLPALMAVFEHALYRWKKLSIDICMVYFESASMCDEWPFALRSGEQRTTIQSESTRGKEKARSTKQSREQSQRQSCILCVAARQKQPVGWWRYGKRLSPVAPPSAHTHTHTLTSAASSGSKTRPSAAWPGKSRGRGCSGQQGARWQPSSCEAS